ncbi:glycosyl transferase family 1 [Endozoicomonas sp. (ex Bugula neritina AB1)]|nr:glycosyl transferase family 1 [Endozoicomonas sp. (ex Bugula neritina AB1)]
MTRLAIVRQKYRPDGGAERFVASALKALSKQKHLDVTVITRKWQGEINPGFQVKICNPLKFGRVSREKRFASAAQQHFSDFDIVQSHERIPGCTIFRAGDGVHKCWLKHRSRILSDSEALRLQSDPFHKYVMGAEKSMFEHSELKAVICISEMIKREILQEFDINENKLHVIYNSVDNARFHPNLRQTYRQPVRKKFGISEDEPCLIFVGSGFERKGLAQAIKSVARAGVSLLVVGKDKNQKHYQQLAEQLGCSDKVHFAGVQEQPEHFYAAADGFILPTLYEPFGNVVLEAMASGLGVITTETCGGADIIQPDKNGYICDALDVEALTHSINCFFQNEKPLSLGLEARKTANLYTAELLSSKLQSLYENCL